MSRLPAPARAVARAITFLTAAQLVSGCTWLGPPPQPRGNHLDAEQMRQLVPGKTTQSDAQTLLGSPTAKGTFNQNTWLYISEMTRPVIGGTQTVLKQNAVELQFDDRGVLRDVKSFDQQNSLPVTIVARTTPSPGTNASFLQQLFGNIGRFNPLGTPSQGVSGGAPTPYP